MASETMASETMRIHIEWHPMVECTKHMPFAMRLKTESQLPFHMRYPSPHRGLPTIVQEPTDGYFDSKTRQQALPAEDRGALQSTFSYNPLDQLLTRASRTGIGQAYWGHQSYFDRQLPPSTEFLRIKRIVSGVFWAMLNTKELVRVLNANVHEQLFSSWLVMSPNATLLAYSGKPNIQQLRDQAALLSQVWKEHKDKLKEQDRATTPADAYSSSASTTVSTIVEGALETLTIENPTSNIIIRAVQPRLLLVLVGGSPPRRATDFFRITPEARGDPRYPEDVPTPESEASSDESAERQTEEAITDEPPTHFKDLNEVEKTQMLSVQRRKLDAATEFMRGDFTSRNFIMPDEMSIP